MLKFVIPTCNYRVLFFSQVATHFLLLFKIIEMKGFEMIHGVSQYNRRKYHSRNAPITLSKGGII